MADDLLKTMSSRGHPSFFGLHLRLEDDYIKYAGLLKGKSPLSKQVGGLPVLSARSLGSKRD